MAISHLARAVLEAIAEIPFPRKENLCSRYGAPACILNSTNRKHRFATEIVLCRKKAASLTCKIIPDKTRTTDKQAPLSAQKMVIYHTSELPTLIERATKLMGLEETTEGKGAFSRDIL